VHAIVEQPNFPNLDHRTPWTSLAPTISGSGRTLAVSAGPGRILSVVGACLLAYLLRNKLHDPDVLVWACGVGLMLRCATESVMVPYYLWPSTLFVALLVTKRRPLLVISGLAIPPFLVVFSDHQMGEWPWWLGTLGALLLFLVIGTPRLKSAPLHDDQIEVVSTGAQNLSHASPIYQRDPVFEAPHGRAGVYRGQPGVIHQVG
jgi:hypothetical protein